MRYANSRLRASSANVTESTTRNSGSRSNQPSRCGSSAVLSAAVPTRPVQVASQSVDARERTRTDAGTAPQPRTTHPATDSPVIRGHSIARTLFPEHPITVTRACTRRRPITLRDLLDRWLRTRAGSCQHTVLMPSTGPGILKTWKPEGARTTACAPPRTCTTSGPGGARAAAAPAAGAAFAHVPAGRTAVVPKVPPGRPGKCCRRDLPPLRAVPGDLSGPGLLAADGHADPDPGGRPGPDAHGHAGSGIAVTGVARSRVRAATRAVPALRGSPGRPLSVTAAGMPSAEAADLARRMAGRHRPPGALRPRRYPRAGRSIRSHNDRPPARLTYADARNAA